MVQNATAMQKRNSALPSRRGKGVLETNHHEKTEEIHIKKAFVV